MLSLGSERKGINLMQNLSSLVYHLVKLNKWEANNLFFSHMMPTTRPEYLMGLHYMAKVSSNITMVDFHVYAWVPFMLREQA